MLVILQVILLVCFYIHISFTSIVSMLVILQVILLDLLLHNHQRMPLHRVSMLVILQVILLDFKNYFKIDRG
ncbi:hypothetical protein GYY_05570 [Methanococcus maripaludis X1]|uniref:Uncharacterized protein n=1 Tax=Methanococcus maripaludis X1 TaxID=1053692 RepID=G0H098_METMI|nr:hypothetical protein GYY_05570 [Methanococcus maripaludis X1]